MKYLSDKGGDEELSGVDEKIKVVNCIIRMLAQWRVCTYFIKGLCVTQYIRVLKVSILEVEEKNYEFHLASRKMQFKFCCINEYKY